MVAGGVDGGFEEELEAHELLPIDGDLLLEVLFTFRGEEVEIFQAKGAGSAFELMGDFAGGFEPAFLQSLELGEGLVACLVEILQNGSELFDRSGGHGGELGAVDEGHRREYAAKGRGIPSRFVVIGGK